MREVGAGRTALALLWKMLSGFWTRPPRLRSLLKPSHHRAANQLAALPPQLLSASPACRDEEAGPRHPHPRCTVSPWEVLQSRQNFLYVSVDVWGFQFLQNEGKGVYKATKHGVYSLFCKNNERASCFLEGQV